MAQLTFDTYEFIAGLRQAGISETQAKAFAQQMKKFDLEHVATKSDLLELKADIFRWAIPLLIGQVILFTGIVSAVVGWMLTLLK